MDPNHIMGSMDLKIVCKVINEVLKEGNCGLDCVILFGGREQDGMVLKAEHQLFIITDSEIDIETYLRLSGKIKIDARKAGFAFMECSLYTKSSFINIINGGDTMGAFLEIVLRNGLLIHDPKKLYRDIRSKVVHDDEAFMTNCINFSKYLNSWKWEDYWTKKLRQYRFRKEAGSIGSQFM